MKAFSAGSWKAHTSSFGNNERGHLEQAVFNTGDDDQFHVKVAHNLKEACELIEAGFEYVTEMDGCKIFRKRK